MVDILIKEYLKNPYKSELFLIEIRFDFEKIGLSKKDSLFDVFSFNYDKLVENGEFLENYYTYNKDKKLYFNKNLQILIVKLDSNFKILSLKEDVLKKLKGDIEKSEINKFLELSEIRKLKSASLKKLPYPFFLEELLDSKNTGEIDFYDKLNTAIRYFKLGLSEKNSLYHYISYIMICSSLEELFSYIAIEEELSLDENYSISNCIKKFKGENWTVTSCPKSKEKDGTKEFKILSEHSSQANIFSRRNKEEGKKLVRLLDEINDIRKKYIHFVHQEPNNPSDNLIGLINFGQFLMWCEENEYL